MSITRINQFEAKAGRDADLRAFLAGVIHIIRKTPGCQSCELLQALDRPEALVILEVWESVDAHQAAASAIPPAMMQEAINLMAVPASGAYYRGVLGDR